MLCYVMQSGFGGGNGHGGDDRDPNRHWRSSGHDSQRYADEKAKMKAKKRLEEGIIAWVSFWAFSFICHKDTQHKRGDMNRHKIEGQKDGK